MRFWKPLSHKVSPHTRNLTASGPTGHIAITVQQNRALESKIQRRPSRIMGKKKKQVPDGGSLLNVNPSLASGTSATASPLGISPAFGSLMSGQGPQMFLRVRVAETADAVHISTTIPV
jgi:hypothetical protein